MLPCKDVPLWNVRSLWGALLWSPPPQPSAQHTGDPEQTSEHWPSCRDKTGGWTPLHRDSICLSHTCERGLRRGTARCTHTALPNGPATNHRRRDQPKRTQGHSSTSSPEWAPLLISLIHSFTHFFIPSFDKYFLRANPPPGTVLGGPPRPRLRP